MAEKTKISWCDAQWSPWRGCTKISPACKNCAAEVCTPVRVDRANGRECWGDNHPRIRASENTRTAPLRWQKKPWVCDECGTVSPQPRCGSAGCYCGTGWHSRRVFFGFEMDFLDPKAPIEWLADALDIIRRCPDLTFLCLTKRPEQFFPLMQTVWRMNSYTQLGQWLADWCENRKAPPNVWVGTSVEDQQRADERIPALLKIPARVRFLSVEPLLETIALRLAMPCDKNCGEHQDAECPGTAGPCIMQQRHLDWLIVGGESGKGFRTIPTQAIVSIAEQCKAAGVPCYVKQDCGPRPGTQGRIPPEIWALKQFPKL